MLLAECPCTCQGGGLVDIWGEQKEAAGLVAGLKCSDGSSIPSGVSQLPSGAGRGASLGLLRKIMRSQALRVTSSQSHIPEGR